MLSFLFTISTASYTRAELPTEAISRAEYLRLYVMHASPIYYMFVWYDTTKSSAALSVAV